MTALSRFTCSDACLLFMAAAAQGMSEWGSILRRCSCMQRRLFLSLALTDEGLDTPFLAPSLRDMLHGLTRSVKPGSDLRVLDSAHHRTALQVSLTARLTSCWATQ